MPDIETHEDKGESGVYELGFHFVPTLGEEDLALRVEEIKKSIADLGGTVIAEGAPEHIALAYTMRKQVRGKWERFDDSYFGWIKFEIAPEHAAMIKDQAQHNEHLLRFLLVTTVREETFVPYSLRKEELFAPTDTEPGVIEKPKGEEEKKGEKPDEAELDKHIDELIA